MQAWQKDALPGDQMCLGIDSFLYYFSSNQRQVLADHRKSVVFIPAHQATRLVQQSTCCAVVLYIFLSKVIIKASQWDVNHGVPPPIEHCFSDLRRGISTAKPLCASVIRTDSSKHTMRQRQNKPSKSKGFLRAYK